MRNSRLEGLQSYSRVRRNLKRGFDQIKKEDPAPLLYLRGKTAATQEKVIKQKQTGIKTLYPINPHSMPLKCKATHSSSASSG